MAFFCFLFFRLWRNIGGCFVTFAEKVMYDVPNLRIVSQSSRMVTLYGVHWQESPKDAIRRIEKENKVPQ